MHYRSSIDARNEVNCVESGEKIEADENFDINNGANKAST